MTAGAIIPQDAAVELVNAPAPGLLMQPVDILRDDGQQLAFLLQLCQPPVGDIWRKT